jgi:hypothetical protein
MGCCFDKDKINKIIKLRTVYISNVRSSSMLPYCCKSKHLIKVRIELKVQKWSPIPMTSCFILSQTVATWLQIQVLDRLYLFILYNITPTQNSYEQSSITWYFESIESQKYWNSFLYDYSYLDTDELLLYQPFRLKCYKIVLCNQKVLREY